MTLHSYNESSADEGEPLMGAGYNDQLRPVTPDPETRLGSGGDLDNSDDDPLGWAL